MSVPSAPILDQWPTCLQTSIQYWWRPPVSGAPLIKYTLACQAIAYSQDIASNVTNYTVTGLTAGTEYIFTLTATNATGVGPVATFPTVAAGLPPFGPSAATVSTINSTTALVSWTASTIANQAPIRWYVVTGLPSSSAASSFYKTQYPYNNSVTIGGLSTNTYYRFLVQGVGAPGYSIPFAYTSTLGFGTPSGVVTEGLLINLTASSYSGSGQWINEGSLGTSANAANNGGTATKNGAGNGIVFNGSTTTWISPPSGNISYGTFTSYTISVWYKRTGPVSANAAFMQAFNGAGSTIAFYLTRRQLDADTEFRLATFNGSTVTLTTKYSFPLNSWVNFTVTHNGSVVETFVNNASIGTTSVPSVPSMGGGMFIGYNGGSALLTGELGQILIYNRVLTSEELSQNYRDTRGVYGV